ncbi:polysaccharide deacetylase family protein [Nocardioides mesophilus]|uniref:Polysaccharide deacetylase family protein n=1 Tax=Nocardioides mesophilus TaxID=433659 RepID=A0A7G9REP5_9ACTN|nr:polysaccharide deacetylase family protein [Nocardioides mesophilus]QNN54070.1 polysaccharide deacetylase family protein [Nocardioides mesophilus]
MTSPASGDSTSPPACAVPARFAGQEISRLPVTQKVVALTFDAGANADGVHSIRTTLRAKSAKATFFLTGAFANRFRRKTARIGAEHLVGNHTNTHPDLTTLTDAQVVAEVTTAQARILQRSGQDPRRFLRFPFGARNQHLVHLVNGLCYVPFRWTVDTLGWKGTSGGMTVRKVVDRVLAAATPGEIVLMHVGSNPDDHSTLDADALPQVIDRLRARGYSFVRLSKVMGAAP